MIPILLIGYLFWLDWRLAAVLIIPIVVGLWLQARMFSSESGQQAYREFQYAVEEMNATGVEYIRGMPAVKIFGIRADSFLTFKQAVVKYRDITLRITDLGKTPYSLFFVLVSSLFTFVVPIGILLASGHSGSQSFAVTLILFLIITPSLSVPLMKLMYIGSGMREIVEGNKRIEAVFAEPIVTEPASPRVPLMYDIAFHHVCFAYEKKESKNFKPVLTDIHFVAKAGGMTAIGGVPIREIGTEKLMDMVSFVFQDVHLFYDTIEANIRMGNTAASKEAVIAAAKTACCHEFIEKLADGYDTKIGEGGTIYPAEKRSGLPLPGRS